MLERLYRTRLNRWASALESGEFKQLCNKDRMYEDELGREVYDPQSAYKFCFYGVAEAIMPIGYQKPLSLCGGKIENIWIYYLGAHPKYMDKLSELQELNDYEFKSDHLKFPELAKKLRALADIS